MLQRPFTLTRVEDGKEWHTVGRAAGDAIASLKYETGVPLFLILENVGDFILSTREPYTGELLRFGVMEGAPKYKAKLFAKVGGTYALSLSRKGENYKLLIDVTAQSVDEGLEILEAAFEKHGVAAEECELIRPAHAEGGN